MDTGMFIQRIYYDPATAIAFIAACFAIFFISLRFFYISVRRSKLEDSSINQRTDFGNIQISMETIENLALKAAGRIKGVKDLKARVRIEEAGLDLMIRTIVDGDTPIPLLTEEMQNHVKGHIEEITGLPVANVSVYVANIVQAGPTFKSRVE